MSGPIRAGDREVGYVLDEIQNGSDPLLLAQWSDPGEVASDEVTRVVTGANPAEATRLRRDLEQRRITHVSGLDDFTARLMLHAGIDPLALSWLAAISADIAYAHRDGEPMAAVDLSNDHDTHENMTRIDVAPDVVWYAAGTLVLYGLPQAVMAQLVEGAPLAPILSHPLLDQHPFHIVDVDADADKALITVDFEGRHEVHRAVAVADLAAMSIPGRR